MKHLLPFAFVAGLAASTTASCIIVHDEPVTGTLTVRWSIEGTYDPAACGWHRAATAHLVVTTPGGAHEASLQPPCTVFATSVGLYPGRHMVSLTILDASGRPVSTTVAVAVDVWAGYTSRVETEFPANAFYQ